MKPWRNQLDSLCVTSLSPPVPFPSNTSEPGSPPLGPVCNPPDVTTSTHNSKNDELQNKPTPAALLPLCRVGVRRFVGFSGTGLARTGLAGVRRVQILCADGDDIVVFAQLTTICRETKVRNRRQCHIVGFEALHPLVDGLVLQLKLEIVFLEVRQPSLCGYGGATNTTCL